MSISKDKLLSEEDEFKKFSIKDQNILSLINLIPETTKEEQITSTIESDPNPNDENYQKSRNLTIKGTKLANEGNLDEALKVLNEAVCVASDNPAAYNDRAQLYRLLSREEDAMADIEKVLSLTKGTKCVSRAQALCQKVAVLHSRGGVDNDFIADEVLSEAASLGSPLAKKLLASKPNIYSKLCSQMVYELLNKDAISND